MYKRVKGPCEETTYHIVGIAMSVHRKLGPGYREAIYQRALEAAFAGAEVTFEAQKHLPVYQEGQLLGYYIPDFIVENMVVVEIKAFASLPQKYLGQVITYLNFTGLPVGLLINFGGGKLNWRRVFPSPQSIVFRHNHHWMFVPNWLKAQKRERGEQKE